MGYKIGSSDSDLHMCTLTVMVSTNFAICMMISEFPLGCEKK